MILTYWDQQLYYGTDKNRLDETSQNCFSSHQSRIKDVVLYFHPSKLALGVLNLDFESTRNIRQIAKKKKLCKNDKKMKLEMCSDSFSRIYF